jgi:adenylosuccinate synthase
MSTPGQIHAVVGGQYGSEAKGHVAAAMHRRFTSIKYAVRVGGPNAGHSAVDDQGRKWALRQIPVAAVVDPNCELVIAAGSEIEPEVLQYEIDLLEAAGFEVKSRLHIDHEATMIDPEHQQAEQHLPGTTGSTGKGIGAARAARIMRTAHTASEFYDTTDTRWLLQEEHERGLDILIEGTQGYALGLRAGWYPNCTSGDCRAIDIVAQTGIMPHRTVDAWVVFRTYPIRIAGPSGAMQNEVDWETLAARSGGYIAAERTTVTQKIRRVGEWDESLAAEAISANGGARYPGLNCALMFVDYLDPNLAGATELSQITASPAWDWIRDTESSLSVEFKAFGTSDRTLVWR